jgi:hypothetical protein
MMMKKVLLGCILIFLMTACAGKSTPPSEPSLDSTALFQTAVIESTLGFRETQNARPTETSTLVSTQTTIPTIDRTRGSLGSPTPETACNAAVAGHPLDITIPDGTVMAPGQSFSKTWRLENVGSCKWTRLYTVTFFSGNSLNAFQTHNLLAEVEPGQEIDITVDMEAPQKAGVYQSNWMLMDTEGELFGIGPNADAPFWVQIEVIASVTDTPQPTPTPTSTPVVYLSGQVVLLDGDQFDLDSDTLNPADGALADLAYAYGGDPLHILNNLNGVIWMTYGETAPTFSECMSVIKTGNAISFDDVPTGTYLCYQTTEMLPGRILIEGFSEGELTITFLTWSVP